MINLLVERGWSKLVIIGRTVLGQKWMGRQRKGPTKSSVETIALHSVVLKAPKGHSKYNEWHALES